MRTGLTRVIFNEEVFKYNADFLSNFCTIVLKKEKKTDNKKETNNNSWFWGYLYFFYME